LRLRLGRRCGAAGAGQHDLGRRGAVAYAEANQLGAGEIAVLAGQSAKALAHRRRVGAEQVGGHVGVDDLGAVVIGGVELQHAAGIDADIGQAERQGAGRSTLVKPDLAILAPVLFGALLVDMHQAAHILAHHNRSRQRRRLKIPHDPTCGGATGALTSFLV